MHKKLCNRIQNYKLLPPKAAKNVFKINILKNNKPQVLYKKF